MANPRALWTDLPNLCRDVITFEMIYEDAMSELIKLPLHLVNRHSDRITREYDLDIGIASLSEPTTLSRHSAKVLKLFPSFCVTGKVYSQHCTSGQPSEAEVLEELSTLALAWEVGEWLESTTFKDAVVDAMHTVMTGHSAGASQYNDHINVHAITTESAGLRRLVVDHMILQWAVQDKSAAYKALRDDGHQLLKDLDSRAEQLHTTSIAERRPFGDLDTCYYHEHRADEECYRTMFPW